MKKLSLLLKTIEKYDVENQFSEEGLEVVEDLAFAVVVEQNAMEDQTTLVGQMGEHEVLVALDYIHLMKVAALVVLDYIHLMKEAALVALDCSHQM